MTRSTALRWFRHGRPPSARFPARMATGRPPRDLLQTRRTGAARTGSRLCGTAGRHARSRAIRRRVAFRCQSPGGIPGERRAHLAGSESRARAAGLPANAFRHVLGLRSCQLSGGLRKRAHSYLTCPVRRWPTGGCRSRRAGFSPTCWTNRRVGCAVGGDRRGQPRWQGGGAGRSARAGAGGLLPDRAAAPAGRPAGDRDGGVGGARLVVGIGVRRVPGTGARRTAA
jgi:hypothetical protein